MVIKFGKLFKELSTNKIVCLDYDKSQNYYKFIKNKQSNGYCQCIVTSDIMITIIQNYILKGNVEIIAIEFMVEDQELQEEIDKLLSFMKQNLGYWEILKKKLSFLRENDSIEMKKVDFRMLDGTGGVFSIQVNGIVGVTENRYEEVTTEISTMTGGCIK